MHASCESPWHSLAKHCILDTCFLLTVPFRGLLLTPQGGPRCLAPTAHQIPVYLMVFSTFLCRAFTAHIDHPIGRVPDAPYPHLTLTVRTDQWISTCALLIPLPVSQPSDELHGALDDAFHLGQGGLHHALHLGKRLRGLHPGIPDALEPFGHRVLHLCGAYNYVARMTQRKIPPHFRGQISPHS